jgi:hypothetical protein
MPELQVSVVLPYYLRLAAGDYQTAQVGEVIQLVAPILLEGTLQRTPVRARFNPDDSADPEEIQKRRARCGEQLLRRINRLLRWYRSVSRQADITELTRAQVSPFLFEAIDWSDSGTQAVGSWGTHSSRNVQCLTHPGHTGMTTPLPDDGHGGWELN